MGHFSFTLAMPRPEVTYCFGLATAVLLAFLAGPPRRADSHGAWKFAVSAPSTATAFPTRTTPPTAVTLQRNPAGVPQLNPHARAAIALRAIQPLAARATQPGNTLPPRRHASSEAATAPSDSHLPQVRPAGHFRRKPAPAAR